MKYQDNRRYRENNSKYIGERYNSEYDDTYHMKRLDNGRYISRDNGEFSIKYNSDLTYSRGGCYTLAKYAMFTVNIIFGIVGFACLALGAWLRTDSRFREFLSERYRQAVAEAFWQAPTLYAFSYILIVFGAVSIVTSMIGCCGTTGRSNLFLITYSIVIFILLIFTISCSFYIIYKKDGIDVELSDALNYMVQHYYQGPGIVQESLDRLQTTFRCCGNAGCGDFLALRLDYPRSCDIRCDGCHHRIWIALSIGASVAIVLFGAVIISQFLAIFISLSLVFSDRDEDNYENKRERYDPAYRNEGFINSPHQQSYNSNQRNIPKNEYNPGKRVYSSRFFTG
ncbi:Tetraspanin family and Tetraspanin, EC2 domain and Tetraspanin/Peripherin family-containing protein [Strongyloides ratti]|uniref:Tetraspanin family and Tetraspanin, EC2 domain and Tetraspanin/Peripherin family-containing protein n=1 Tax=Strongyloides ratti TaxID=34506 RepID=A0A090KVM7_STRRB|nr:Tetraspanin family and Tetraspanin, EC2 domain and Tetraspanin/Peripherin family-containing protein [Strongyloides ratti]CEF59925.1 Tetraspanin family and Tetraspanin, EC2 domain and Tetraspanin/Peripherin family-containing protein [Strongyloides ratti]